MAVRVLVVALCLAHKAHQAPCGGNHGSTWLAFVPSQRPKRPQRALKSLSPSMAISSRHAPTRCLWNHHTLVNSSQIMVEDGTEQGLQRITLSTDMPGKLLLHWGVEGGEGYKAGWRLPGEASWPEGTVKYKDRALQTPFRYVHGSRVI